MPKNLSEQLFKPRFTTPETSTLVNRLAKDATNEADLHSWYRVLKPVLWQWRGLPGLEIEEVLARIAVADKPRSHEQLLDTVVNYQSGNWIYEFMTQAAKWQLKADALTGKSLDASQRQQCADDYLTASRFASLASYPHYKHDELAGQAQLYAYRTYRQALEYSQFAYQDLQFDIAGQSVNGFLHLPHASSTQAVPVLVMCPGLSDLQIDFYHYFVDYLAPKGIALLTLDLPGVAASSGLKLQQESSYLYQAVVEQLAELPWINAEQIMLAGIHLGCQMALRTAYLLPNRIKAVLCFAPILHHLLVDTELQQHLPSMYKDLIANRLAMNNVSDATLAAEMRYYSLKNQGLLNRACSAPVLSVVFKDDLLNSLADTQLIHSLKQSKIIKVPNSPLKAGLKSALEQSSEWLSKQI